MKGYVYIMTTAVDGIVKIGKLNCDESGDIAMVMGIMSIPCMVMFKNGQELDRLVGLHSKDEIIEFIEKYK